MSDTMVYVAEGDIFESNADFLVNPVNCVGVMGGGLARQFAERYGEEYLAEYRKECNSGELAPGHCTFWSKDMFSEIVVNFPTKDHWKDPSTYAWVATGMIDLAHAVSRYPGANKTVALPALGCGLGNLSWDKVKHIIKMGVQFAPEVTWTVYLPPPPGHK